MGENLELYLKPSYFVESNDPEIQKLARKLVGNKRGRYAINALFTWVRDSISWDILEIIGAKALLKREPKRAECIDKNFLFVALCRSMGIPARFVILKGIMKTSNPKLKVEFPHVASEVFIDGEWTLTDVSFSKDTEKIADVCEFGEPSWESTTEINRAPEIPKEAIDGINKTMKTDPKAQILKQMIAEVGKK